MNINSNIINFYKFTSKEARVLSRKNFQIDGNI